MAREHRTRADGTDIDPVANLAEFVQSFPASAEAPPKVEAKPSAPEAAPAPPTAPEPIAQPAPDPEFAGKSPEEIIAAVRSERERAAQLERQHAQTKAELDGQRLKSQIESTAREVLREQQPKPQAEPAKPDPRWQEVDDLWFAEPAKARGLLKQLQDEEYTAKLAAERERTKQEIRAESEAERRKQQGEYATHTALQRLVELGATIDTNKVTAVYSMITRPPTASAPNPYYDRGGPLNPDVIVEAWRDLIGLPATTPGTSAPPHAAPQVVVPPAPPGSGKPAPAAAAPAQTSGVRIDANTKRDYDHMAEVFGYDKEKLLNRRRQRLERERN